MRIAVIGVGNVGGALAPALAWAGHQVLVTGSRDPENARRVAAAACGAAGGNGGGVTAEPDVAEAARDADVVLLAVPFEALDGLLTAEVRSALEGTIVVDVINPVTPDYLALTMGFTTSAAEEVARRLPASRVVKALNTVFAQTMQTPTIDGRALMVPVASDDEAARQAILGLVSQLGFDAVDAGPLRNARYLEPVAELLIQLGYATGLGTAIGFALQQAR
jgi:NADPH-dependent F420 reductase